MRALPTQPNGGNLDARSSTPTLLRKASMNSLHGITPPRPSPSRRSSSAHVMNDSPKAKSPLSRLTDTPPPPRATAASIAASHFKSELEIHEEGDEARPTDTIVILHDSCYGHRFSRPRTSRAALSTIVERPERIQASVLGLSVAYVRLGQRHSEGQFPLHPSKSAYDIPTIPFRIRKTSRKLPLSSPAVTNVHGAKWMEELKIMCDSAEAKLAKNGKELTRPEITRSPEGDEPSKLHEGDLYLCSESLNAMEGALGAVCEGVDAVFQGSASGKGPHRTFIAIRPPGHHCSASYPSGFCWLNNVHVGISHAALAHGLTHAAIIDFDLHHGDGSQAIAWAHNTRAKNAAKNAAPWKKTSIGYFSLHDINSYPCEMGDEEKVKNASICVENAHGQNIWNVHLQPWKSEAEFWELYESKYAVLLEKTRNYLRAQTDRLRASPNLPKPKSAIFLSAGFDASEWESAGMQRHKVNVPTEFYARLTRDVVEMAAEEGCAAEGRVISVLEGGYSDRALCTGVFSHISGLAGGKSVAVKKEEDHGGLGYEMGQKIGLFDNAEKSPTYLKSAGIPSYDPLWWSLPKLEQLDAVMNPAPITSEPRDSKDTIPPTYSSPTQSFTAKIVASPRMNRSLSSMSAMSNGSPRGSPRAISRAPSPPPPEVHWTVAAVELSKILIPGDRQTSSCKPEDLSAEATRVRRDRQSILTPPTTVTEAPSASSNPSTRMALRERKPPKSTFDSGEDDSQRPKIGRRKTATGTAVLAAEKATSRGSTPKFEPLFPQPSKQSDRRQSASNTTSVASEAPLSRPPGGNVRATSNGSATFPNRPESVQTARPDSSMSSRGPISSIAVKKTRAPAQTRNEVPKPSRVRRKSPLGDAKGAIEPPTRSSNPTIPAATQSSSADTDMDSLTAGMKKIKINLTTKAQREAKEAANVAVKNSSLPKYAPIRPQKPSAINAKIKIPSRPGNEKLDAQKSSSTDQPMPDIFPPNPSTPEIKLHPMLSEVEEAVEVPLPASSPPRPVDTTDMLPPKSVPQTNGFISYKPDGPPASSIVQTEQLQWLPPNTATPTVTPGPTPVKRDLPVFTATSAIPFGIPPQVSSETPQAGQPQDATEPDDSMREVPETPDHS
ncbi:histone deacetylase HOS3 [Phlyctema vagabunda]|uniref:Histone deacetylase HOS3 n=1 Tax=Phlyctema vagabunda TaxID=108571 RepID=A0ABR4PRN4_9HELO